MKRIFLTLMACIAILTANAQVSDIRLGYSGDALPPSGNIFWSEADTWVSGAIYIPAGTISTYAGNYISGVNAGLASRLNIQQLTVWVRSELDGDNLVERTIPGDGDQQIVKGWNTVEFETPWMIPDNGQGLYVGYSYYQKGAAFGVAALDTPADNAFYVKFGDNAWEDRCKQGTLCVEALIRGEKLPKVNLSLSNVTVPENFILEQGTLEVGGMVKNLATHTVSAFDVAAYGADGEKIAAERVDMQLAYGESGDFNVTFAIPAEAVKGDTLPLTITVENIAEGADEDMSDNSVSVETGVVAHDYTHRVLVEEFTTEKCPNCPRVGNYLHDILAKDEFSDVIAVCHHSGYYTDWLTTPFDNEYLWLYNAGGSTYAPAIMVDRVAADNTSTAVFNPGSQTEFENSIRRQMRKPAYVSLNIKAAWADGGNVEVTVDGEKSVEELCENPRITVYVVQDNINARSQAGATGWTHQHVNRVANATWGEAIDFEDNQYSYTCRLRIDRDWVREDMKIVAFVSNYNQYDATDCPVFNAQQIDFSEVTGSDGVASIATDSDIEPEWYTLQGVRVANPSEGIYIRRQGTRAEKVVVR